MKLPHHDDAIEIKIDTYTIPLIECGSLPTFLDLLRGWATIFVRPLGRTLTLDQREARHWHQYAVHLTARAPQHEWPICYATFTAATLLEIGSLGQLMSPLTDPQPDHLETVQTRATTLLRELENALITTLQHHNRVAVVHRQARYVLPDELVWKAAARLHGSDITFRDGHWIHLPNRFNR